MESHAYTSIRLEITSKCNLDCLFCHNKEHLNRGDDMTTEEILLLIQNLTHEYAINKILLTGGEPLKQDDLCTIIKYITDLGIKADMVTNGTLLTKEMVLKLQEAGLKRIRISIDEILPSSSLRSNTSTDMLWEKAKMICEDSSIEVCIHTVASPNNVKQLFDIYNKVCSIGAKRWRVFDIGYQGGVVNNQNYLSLKTYYEDLIHYTSLILKHYIKHNLKDVLDIEINNIFRTAFLDMDLSELEEFDVSKELSRQLLASPCEYVTDHQLSIRSDGTATLCQYFHNTIFDYKGANFDVAKAISNKRNVDEDHLKLGEVAGCSNCKYVLLCNSGCRSRAKHLTGDIREADPVGCFLHQLVHKEIIPILPENVIKTYEANILKDGDSPKFSEEDLDNFLRMRGYIV